MSGKDFNLWHSLNKFFIFNTLFVFQFEISGNEINSQQWQNVSSILSTLLIFQLDKSGNSSKATHL